MSDSVEKSLQQEVRVAGESGQSLEIVGGGSKSFYGYPVDGVALQTNAHKGVVHYDPTELVITVRAGTAIADLEELLALKNQMLAFEPPRFAGSATIGGAVAAGIAGPRRPYAGSIRDSVLGVKILTGRGELLRFGGQVMKNVAGFDVSRLMVGAQGILGVVLEVSLRVVPKPPKETTLVLQEPDAGKAIILMNQFAGRPLPLSAAAWYEGELRLRLSGSESGVDSAVSSIGGEPDPLGHKYWQQLRDHDLPFFGTSQPLLRASVPPAAAMFAKNASQLLDWGGGQRWIVGDVSITDCRRSVADLGGHVTLFRHVEQPEALFQALDPVVHQLHARLKKAFDPAGVLNPGRMYPEL